MRALVVVPTYNEAENVGELLERVRASGADVDVLVVDDGSPDGTADLVERLARGGGRVAVLRRTRKEGLGVAYRAGFARGRAEGYDVLVEMDADLSHDPAALPELLGGIAAGADLVIGSRYVAGGSVPGWSWQRRSLSRWGNRYASLVLGLPVHDATAGFRAYRAELLERIGIDRVSSHGYTFQIETTYAAHRAGGAIVEVPITFVDRVRGTSKMSGRIIAEGLARVLWWALRDRVLRRGRGAGALGARMR